MNLFSASNWFRSPADRDIISRRTVASGCDPVLRLPPPADPERFTFLALGDSGDSESAGRELSPQDAVAREMAADARLPDSGGSAEFVVHVGDMVYMTGERRLYDRNFRRPYAAFLTPESTVDNLVFRLPFLPVPGNHDYYDLGGWGRAVARMPVVGAGIRAISREIFAYSLPESGSGMGGAFMDAFVCKSYNGDPLPYVPGEQTRIPNRYYRFSHGSVDFFALDSNTLDPPAQEGMARVREEAARHVAALQKRARTLDRELRRDELALERWHAAQRERLAKDAVRRAALTGPVKEVDHALGELAGVLSRLASGVGECGEAERTGAGAHAAWREAAARLAAAGDAGDAYRALEALDRASDECCTLLRQVEDCLLPLPEGAERSDVLAARDALEASLKNWCAAGEPPPPQELQDRLRTLSETALDVQRELAREKRRMRFRPEDHDAEQIDWFVQALEQSERERPDAWRILYLHHPPYTTITNHCERPDVQGVRENLLSLIRGRVHLVLGGHSHSFEWIRSDALPTAGLFVTGGGGQLSLRRAVLDPRRIRRYGTYYHSLRTAGVTECAVGGRGPALPDGSGKSVYHYLRVEVTPEAIIVRPVGVRRLPGGFRREEPMPVYHAWELPEGPPPWEARALHAVEVRRDRPPRPLWG